MAKRTRREAAGATTDQAPGGTNKLPLPPTGIGSIKYWEGEVEDAETRLKQLIPGWKHDLAIYAGQKPKLFGVNADDVVSVNVPFYTAEGKQPNLFYSTPFVQVEPEMPESAQAAPLVQEIINFKLGRKGVNAMATMDEVIKDLLVTAGIGCSKVGYERVTVEVPTNRMEPVLDAAGLPPVDPATGAPVIDPTTGRPPEQLALVDGKPETKKEAIYSRIYFNRFSPADLRLPRGFTSSRYEHAPWVGWAFPLSSRVLDEHDISSSSVPGLRSELSLRDDSDTTALAEVPMGIEIWYKAYLYDPKVKNPELIRQLVIAPGGSKRGKNADPRVLVHRDSPWQRFDKIGRFVGGMRGFPIKIFTLRGQPETAYPNSDAKVLRDVANEKSMGRTLMVQQRRRNLPMVAADKNRVTKDTIDQIEKGTVQRIILTDGPADEVLSPLDRSPFPVENFEFDRAAQLDIDRLSAAGANQQSLPNNAADTATEANYIQRAYDNRLSKERERVLEDFLDVAEKVFALIQLFADEEEVIRIMGENRMPQLVTWNKDQIQGRFAFKLKPDSSERTNAAEERELFLRLFNLIANAPGVNTLELIKMLVAKFNLNPKDLVADKLPEAPPQTKPTISLSINPAIDLNPESPQYATVIEILKLAGINIPQPQGPITSPEGVPPVNQHDADLTGNMPGAGPPTRAA